MRRIFGDNWRGLPDHEVDGAWGIAIVRSVLDGATDLNEQPYWVVRHIGQHLGVDPEELRDAFSRLNANGVLLRNRLHNDRKALNSNDIHAWCQYAGIASGATGMVIRESRKKKDRPGSTR